MSRLLRFAKAGSAALLLFALPTLGAPAPAAAQFSVGFSAGLSVNIGPPALPVYVQPPCPGPNLIWTPGFWAWGPAGYYWVPGTWVAAPQPGYLWTPGYWGYTGGYYAWHGGYWGPHVGFYGGLNYGAGYFGVGYVGGGWYGGAFRYNTAVTNVNTTIVHNTYVNNTVVVNNYNTSVNRVSYNGGPGGVHAEPNEEERTAMQAPHVPATQEQRQHITTASQDRNNLASVNHGEVAPERAAYAQPLSRENRPAGYTPLHAEDRQAAQEHVISQPHPANGFGGQSMHSSYAEPGAQHPAQPSYAHPAQASYAHPAQPSYQQHPAQPSYAHPAQPSYTQPHSQAYQHPGRPAYQQHPPQAAHPQGQAQHPPAEHPAGGHPPG